MQLTFEEYLSRQPTIIPKYDRKRLGAQYSRVLELMLDGKWRTLKEIEEETGDPAQSVSARTRDFERDGYKKEKRRRGNPYRGIWEYRITE